MRGGYVAGLMRARHVPTTDVDDLDPYGHAGYQPREIAACARCKIRPQYDPARQLSVWYSAIAAVVRAPAVIWLWMTQSLGHLLLAVTGFMLLIMWLFP